MAGRRSATTHGGRTSSLRSTADAGRATRGAAVLQGAPAMRRRGGESPSIPPARNDAATAPRWRTIACQWLAGVLIALAGTVAHADFVAPPRFVQWTCEFGGGPYRTGAGACGGWCGAYPMGVAPCQATLSGCFESNRPAFFDIGPVPTLPGNTYCNLTFDNPPPSPVCGDLGPGHGISTACSSPASCPPPLRRSALPPYTCSSPVLPKQPPGGCEAQGNPICPQSGNKHQVEADYRGPGSFPLEFRRYYNGAYQYAIADGNYWRHTYSRSIETSASLTAGNATGPGATA
jgi:hypothetical protein